MRNGTTFVALNVASCDIGYNAYEGLLPNLIFKYHYAIFDTMIMLKRLYLESIRPNGEANVVVGRMSPACYRYSCAPTEVQSTSLSILVLST